MSSPSENIVSILVQITTMYKYSGSWFTKKVSNKSRAERKTDKFLWNELMNRHLHFLSSWWSLKKTQLTRWGWTWTHTAHSFVWHCDTLNFFWSTLKRSQKLLNQKQLLSIKTCFFAQNTFVMSSSNSKLSTIPIFSPINILPKPKRVPLTCGHEDRVFRPSCNLNAAKSGKSSQLIPIHPDSE